MSKYFLNSLRFLIDEFKFSSKKFKTVTYFRQSIHSYLLWIHVLEYHYSNRLVTSEQIADALKHYASRKTVLTILNDAVKMSYLEKKKSTLDARVTHYSPTEVTIKEYEVWKQSLKDNI